VRLMRCHTVRFASSITLPVRIVGYVKSVTSVKWRVRNELLLPQLHREGKGEFAYG
jgi:hypothetical protein